MSIRVLVVDDSSTMRKIIRRTQVAIGVTGIVEAGDGVEALEVFGQSDFDLVMLDWNMPEKNGFEVLEDIHGQGSDVPIMMVTTEAERFRIEEALCHGVSDYLIKPFQNDVLQQ